VEGVLPGVGAFDLPSLACLHRRLLAHVGDLAEATAADIITKVKRGRGTLNQTTRLGAGGGAAHGLGAGVVDVG